ncbi:DinI-like family protein [Aliamphritea ceti]|uniref:DinI-like family protein n=1 Tax=Aliamphritea ceti TaxID=1524258 RepID=UPI0021C296F9|nr:DinI-like family protein [Aliamphritea ceti]
MLIEMTVNKMYLPDGGFEKLDTEMKRRLSKAYPTAHVFLRQGHSFQLSVIGAAKPVKTSISYMLEEMFEESCEWLQE